MRSKHTDNTGCDAHTHKTHTTERGSRSRRMQKIPPAQTHTHSFRVNQYRSRSPPTATENHTDTHHHFLPQPSPGIAVLNMDKKSDVKAMMARFEVSESGNDDTSPAGRAKQPLGPTLSSGSTVQTKKPLGRESFSGSAIIIPPKSALHKHSVSTKNDTVVEEPNKTKALTSRFANTQEDTNARIKPFIGNKQQISMKPPLSKPPEAKGLVQKPPLNKPPLTSSLSDSKPKPPPALISKPSWVKPNTVPSRASSPPKISPLQQKPSSSMVKLWQQNEEKAGAKMDTADKPSPQKKPLSNFRASQNMSNKEKDNSEQQENGGTSKAPPSATNSVPPLRPLAAKKPSLKRTTKDSPQTDNADAIGPKRNPLPNALALGPAPAKPNRPPKVNLENFKRGAVASEDGPGTLRKSIVPAPHPSNHRNPGIPPPAIQADLPSLPPRHPGSIIQQDDIYDDLEDINSTPPPLPPPSGHPSQWAKEEIDDDDGDTYDDLDDRWDEVEQKQEKQKEKEAKEVKKRQEAEKKEQKDREKKEQDARKKFKLVGPLEVIQKGKACVDCKGSKTDLCMKLGDSLDILRVQGNPEGKWLGRTQDGSIGFVKTISVEIDFNSLKNRSSTQEYDPEVYDDIDVASADTSSIKGPGVVLPPLPGDEGEIYDDVVDLNLEGSPVDTKASFVKSLSFLRTFERKNRLFSTKVVPPPSQFAAQGNSDPTEDEEIYDDVDSQSQLPPLPSLKGRSRSEEIDPKKQKKFEKEEKDFRKKFKYDGEIQVLHQVTIVHTLTNKRWTGKELPIKAGEQLDVIVGAVDNKLICRNEEGKFGHVSTGHIVTDDGDIYDDIRDDCVYDND